MYMPRQNRCGILTQIGKFKEALVDAEKMIELKKDDREPWLAKAKVLLGLQRYQEAKTLLDQGIKEGVDKHGFLKKLNDTIDPKI